MKPGDRVRERHAEAVVRVQKAHAARDALTHDRESSTDDDEHDPDGVTLSAEWSRLAGLVEAAEAELREADGAIARLDAGTYGICVDCDRPIPTARLDVRPFATRCVPCAEDHR